MHISVEEIEKYIWIRFNGDFTIYNAMQIHNEFKKTIQQKKKYNIDLDQVGDIDSAGIQLLAYWKIHCQKNESSFELKNHPETVISIFSLFGLTGFFADKIKITKKLKDLHGFNYGMQKIDPTCQLIEGKM